MDKYGYVVLNRSFAYDDEQYTPEEGGTPVKIYLHQNEAEEKALDANILFVKGIELRDYCYNLRELVSYSRRDSIDNVEDSLTQIIGESCYNDEGWEIPHDRMDREKYRKMFDLLDLLKSNYIMKVEIK